MKRILVSVALLVLSVTPAPAQEQIETPRPAQAVGPQAAPPQAGRPRTHRFQISSWGVWVRTDAPGYPAYRYTYRGEIYGFQRPAIFQYGNEHQMQENGPFSLNGQWH